MRYWFDPEGARGRVHKTLLENLAFSARQHAEAADVTLSTFRNNVAQLRNVNLVPAIAKRNGYWRHWIATEQSELDEYIDRGIAQSEARRERLLRLRREWEHEHPWPAPPPDTRQDGP